MLLINVFISELTFSFLYYILECAECGSDIITNFVSLIKKKTTDF